jgi:hypothetical protein
MKRTEEKKEGKPREAFWRAAVRKVGRNPSKRVASSRMTPCVSWGAGRLVGEGLGEGSALKDEEGTKAATAPPPCSEKSSAKTLGRPVEARGSIPDPNEHRERGSGNLELQKQFHRSLPLPAVLLD